MESSDACLEIDTERNKALLMSEKEFERILTSTFIFPENPEDTKRFRDMLIEIAQTQIGVKLLTELDKERKISLEIVDYDEINARGAHTAGEIRLADLSNTETLVHELEHERQFQKDAIGIPISYDNEVLNKGLYEINARITGVAFSLEKGRPSHYPVDGIRINYLKKIFKDLYPTDEEKQLDMALKCASVCAILAIKNPEKDKVLKNNNAAELLNLQHLESFWELERLALLDCLESKREIFFPAEIPVKDQNEFLATNKLLKGYYLNTSEEKEWKDAYFNKTKSEGQKDLFTDTEKFCMMLSGEFLNPLYGTYNFLLNDSLTDYYDVSEAVQFLISSNFMTEEGKEILKTAMAEQTKTGMGIERILLKNAFSRNNPENLYNLADDYSERIEKDGKTVNFYINDTLSLSKTADESGITTVLYNQEGKHYCTIKEKDGKKTLTSLDDSSELIIQYDKHNRKSYVELNAEGVKKGYQTFSYDKNKSGGVIISSFNSANNLTALSIKLADNYITATCKEGGTIKTILISKTDKETKNKQKISLTCDTLENMEFSAISSSSKENTAIFLPSFLGGAFISGHEILTLKEGQLFSSNKPYEPSTGEKQLIEQIQAIQKAGSAPFKAVLETLKNEIQRQTEKCSQNNATSKPAKISQGENSPTKLQPTISAFSMRDRGR